MKFTGTSAIAAAASVTLGYLAIRTDGFLAVPLATAAVGALLVALKQDGISTGLEVVSSRFDGYLSRRKAGAGKVSRYVLRPIASIDGLLQRAIAKIDDPYIRAGASATTKVLVVESVLYALTMVAMVVAAVVIFGMVLVAVYYGMRATGGTEHARGPSVANAVAVRRTKPAEDPALRRFIRGVPGRKRQPYSHGAPHKRLARQRTRGVSRFRRGGRGPSHIREIILR